MKLYHIRSYAILIIIIAFAIVGAIHTSAESSYLFRSLNSSDGLPDGYIQEIISDKDGHIYISSSKGLYKYDGNKMITIADSSAIKTPSLYKLNIPHKISHESNKSTFVASNGNVWIYDSFGYGLESHETGKVFFNKDIIKDVDEDANGNLWIATNNNGIIIFNTKTDEYEYLQHDSSISNSLPTNHTTCVFIDSISSTAWIGTSNNGVAVTSLHKHTINVKKTGVEHDISCFSIVPGEDMIIGYDGGGLFNEKNTKIELSGEIVTNLHYDQIKQLTYVATYGEGIFIIKDNRVEQLTGCGPHSPVAFARQMNVDKEGNLWIGTFSNGLVKYADNGDIKEYRTGKIPLGSNCIVGLDRHGDTLYIASTAGMSTLDLKTMNFKKQSLPENIDIKAFGLDRNSRPWIVTAHYLLTPDHQELPIKNARALTFDLANNCWITATDGLNVVLPPKEEKQEYRFYHFPAKITGNSNGFSKFSILTKPNGNILAGSFGTYIEFSPSDLIGLCQTSLKISSSSINNKSLEFYDKIIMQSNDTLNIDFGSSNYIVTENERFGYKLLPDTTIHLIDKPHISLTGINVGGHELQLFEFNSGDTVNIHLDIRRPLSYYIRIGIIIILCLLIFVLIYFKYFKKLKRPTSEGILPADKQFLDKITIILEKELGNSEFSVEAFATEMGMSRSNLYKKISQLMGKSPLEFLRDKRIEKGKQLLDEGHSHIGQVAYSVGLSPKQFSKFFKEKYGVLPSEYIKPSK